MNWAVFLKLINKFKKKLVMHASMFTNYLIWVSISPEQSAGDAKTGILN